MGQENATRKRLVIVGSGPIYSDQSQFIDDSDCVVRFNQCKNLGPYTGAKTDILFLNNVGDPEIQQTLAHLLKEREKTILDRDLPFLKNLKKAIFVRPLAADFRKFLVEGPGPSHPLYEFEMGNTRHDRDIAEEISRSLQLHRDTVERLSPEFHMQVWQMLCEYSGGGGIMPSTGALGVQHILTAKEYAGYDKYVIGFSHRGWKGHSWNSEMRLMRTEIKNGRLKPLPGTTGLVSTLRRWAVGLRR